MRVEMYEVVDTNTDRLWIILASSEEDAVKQLEEHWGAFTDKEDLSVVCTDCNILEIKPQIGLDAWDRQQKDYE